MFRIIWILAALVIWGKVEACTGIVNKAEDGSWVYARTMEFGADLVSFDLFFAPRGIKFDGQMKDSTWTNKYAFVGFNPFGLPLVADGINEKGLACGGFYFPGYAKYQQADNKSKSISNLDLITWILSTFSTVDEVRNALQEIKVVGVTFGPWGIIPPLHYVVVDQKGNKAVIEYVGGELKLYEMPLATITNSPGYDWHMLNARNYVGLKALNSPSIEINGSNLSQFGQGSGAIGLPGDFTPPSRFIRACFLNQVTLPAADALANVKRAFKILNQFDIPKGAVRENEKGKIAYEETQWTSAADLSGLKYNFHTAENRTIRSVNLKDLDLNAKESKSIKIHNPESFVDITMNFNNS